MTCRERIERIFKGELVDCVPFALKGWRISQCEMERTLRNDGLCIIDSRPVYRTESPNTDWYVEYMFKGPEDYDKILAMIDLRPNMPLTGSLGAGYK